MTLALSTLALTCVPDSLSAADKPSVCDRPLPANPYPANQPVLHVAASATPAIAISAGPQAADIRAERGEIWLSLNLRHLGVRAVRVGYEIAGRSDGPVVVALGGISANAHVTGNQRDASPGWWQAQVGPGRALDPTRYRILGIDWIGADGRVDGAIDSADQADALAAVLDALRIRRVDAVIGASYGAMVGLAFAQRHGHRLQQLIAISGGDRPHPYASAWRSIQRNIVRLANTDPQRVDALALARQLALLSYRTPEEFGERFDARPTAVGDHFEVAAEPYLQARGRDFVQRFDATAFLRLSESIDLHCVDPTRIEVPVTLVAIEQDRLVPITDLYTLAERLPKLRRLVRLSSRYGHDAFLKEESAIAELLLQALTPCQVAA